MKNYRNLCAQAVACVVLSSSVIGMEDPIPMFDFAQMGNPFVLQAPRAGDGAVVPRTPPRKAAPLHMASPSSKIPDRPWLYDGTRVIACDIEADARLGGRMTEISLIEQCWGEQTGRSLHYYFNPKGEINYRYVKKVDPIDQSQQPTFEQVAKELYEFIDGATLVTYGSFDVRKLCEHFGILKPYGQVFKFTWRDALQMERRDFARKEGQVIFSPSAKTTEVISESPTKRKKEYAKKRKASRDQKEISEFKKFIASQTAHKAGLPSPKRKKPDSIYDGVSFKQGDVAVRKDISASTGMASVGGSAEDLNQRHGIPQEHVGEAHHAMHDTQILTGILAAQGQPTLKRRVLQETAPVRSPIRRANRSLVRGDASPSRLRVGKENRNLVQDADDDDDFPVEKSRKRALKLDFDTSGDVDTSTDRGV